MKVYLVDVDNGGDYEDYEHEVEGVFLTYRGASQDLIDEGYVPYYIRDVDEYELRFYWQYEGWKHRSMAKIIEKEVREC